MTIQYVGAISNRLSLRPPQRTSLEILTRVCELRGDERVFRVDRILSMKVVG